jgi:hypothetical protein
MDVPSWSGHEDMRAILTVHGCKTGGGSAGNMSRILVSNELGDDVASIGRSDKDEYWWTVLGGGERVVYDGDQSDRSKPMPIEVAKGQLGSDYMYRVPLRDLAKAKERIRIAAIRVPTERIIGASATPEPLAPKSGTPSPEG